MMQVEGRVGWRIVGRRARGNTTKKLGEHARIIRETTCCSRELYELVIRFTEA